MLLMTPKSTQKTRWTHRAPSELHQAQLPRMGVDADLTDHEN